MQLTPAQLPDHLAKHGLPAVVCVFGDAPLLVDDAIQHIRQWARQHRIDERLGYVHDSQFDWRQLTDQSASLSLFSTHKSAELDMPDAKAQRDGADALRRSAQHPPAGQTLVLFGPPTEQEQPK